MQEIVEFFSKRSFVAVKFWTEKIICREKLYQKFGSGQTWYKNGPQLSQTPDQEKMPYLEAAHQVSDTRFWKSVLLALVFARQPQAYLTIWLTYQKAADQRSYVASNFRPFDRACGRLKSYDSWSFCKKILINGFGFDVCQHSLLLFLHVSTHVSSPSSKDVPQLTRRLMPMI